MPAKDANLRTVVNLADIISIKHCLDEETKSYFKDAGFKENLSVNNWKLVLGYIAVVIAIIGHFYPVPYPKSHYVLVLCVCAFFVLHWTFHFVHSFVEKDIILFTYPKTEGSKVIHPAVHVSTNMYRYEPTYHLTLKYDSKNPSEICEYAEVLQIANFFDVDGRFVHETFRAALKMVYGKFLVKANDSQAKKKQ